MRYHVHTLNYNHFSNHDSGHLDFSRWPKINRTCPIDNMKTNFKFEVDWGNDFKDIAFTSIIFTTVHIFQKFNRGHLVLSRWPKINSVCPLGGMAS